jgi:hypothetical protein
MEESPDTSKEAEERFALVERVTNSLLEIREASLVECHARQNRHLIIGGIPLAISIQSKSQCQRIPEANGFVVVVTFALKATTGTQSHADEPKATEDNEALSIEYVIALPYIMRTMDEVEDKHLAAFAEFNSKFNAWPYWREFVQSTMARMGLPPIILPVFRPGMVELKGVAEAVTREQILPTTSAT